ncbi:MAG: AbrB/MazE/SpoVT family DNA-binding domain-containing protein [Clostridia bacterium]
MATRKVDTLGRVVIPQDMRDKLNIVCDVTYLDIDLKGNKIVLSKSKTVCLVCGGTGKLLEGTQVCHECAKKIRDEINSSQENVG